MLLLLLSALPLLADVQPRGGCDDRKIPLPPCVSVSASSVASSSVAASAAASAVASAAAASAASAADDVPSQNRSLLLFLPRPLPSSLLLLGPTNRQQGPSIHTHDTTRHVFFPLSTQGLTEGKTRGAFLLVVNGA